MQFEMKRLNSESGKSFVDYAARPPWGSSVDPNSAGSSERPCRLADSVLRGGRWKEAQQMFSPNGDPYRHIKLGLAQNPRESQAAVATRGKAWGKALARQRSKGDKVSDFQKLVW